MDLWLIILLIVLAVLIVGVIVWVISAYNNFVRLRNNIDEAFSTMDIYMKKRYDLIPNLVETVKGYAKHESQTLENVIKARNIAVDASSVEDKIKGENLLTGALKSVFALSESYPNLKADSNFIDLQNTLKSLEHEIASSRKYYNGTVKVYNTKREMFPSNIIAKSFKFEKKPLYEVDSVEERKNVKVEF